MTLWLLYTTFLKICQESAKQDLEHNLRKYVLNQENSCIIYAKMNISENASYILKSKKSLNELIADTVILLKQGKLNDKKLESLVKEVLEYDGNAN